MRLRSGRWITGRPEPDEGSRRTTGAVLLAAHHRAILRRAAPFACHRQRALAPREWRFPCDSPVRRRRRGAPRRPKRWPHKRAHGQRTGDGRQRWRWRDVGGAVIAALHPFAPLGTSAGGAGRLDISARTVRGPPDLLCTLSSLSAIRSDNRVSVSDAKKAVDHWLHQTA